MVYKAEWKLADGKNWKESVGTVACINGVEN